MDVEQAAALEQNVIDVDMLSPDPLPADDTGTQAASKTFSRGEEEALSTEAPLVQTPSTNDSNTSSAEPNAVCSPSSVLHSRSDHFLQSSPNTIKQIPSASRDTIEQIPSAPPTESAPPTLSREQMDSHISDILARLNGLTIHGQQVDKVLASILSTMNLGKSMLEDQGKSIEELHTRPSGTTIDRNAAREMARDVFSPVVRSEAATFQVVLVSVMTHFLSTYGAGVHSMPIHQFASVGTSTRDLESTSEPVMIAQRQFATVGTSTSDLAPTPEPVMISQRRFATVGTSTSDLAPTPKRIMVSSATQTDDDGVPVASTTRAIETPYVPCDNSEIQPATILMDHETVKPVTRPSPEPMEYSKPSPSPNFPTSDLRATGGDTFEGHPSSNHDMVDTETQGTIIAHRFSS